jgi:subtilisin family serine protease
MGSAGATRRSGVLTQGRGPAAAKSGPPDDTRRDGGGTFWGTSAAAPRTAGAAAVVRGVRNNGTPAQVTQALASTAIDVRAGRCHPRSNNPATPGRDLAIGSGLINVSAAAWII